MQPGDFGFKLLEIRRYHLPAGSHNLINLILNFTRLGFQPLIFCVPESLSEKAWLLSPFWFIDK